MGCSKGHRSHEKGFKLLFSGPQKPSAAAVRSMEHREKDLERAAALSSSWNGRKQDDVTLEETRVTEGQPRGLRPLECGSWHRQEVSFATKLLWALSRQAGASGIELGGGGREHKRQSLFLEVLIFGVLSWGVTTFQESSFSEVWDCYLKRDLLSVIENKDSPH